MRLMASRLLMVRADPTSNTMASAISTTTRRSRMRAARRPEPVRPPSFSASPGLTVAPCHAGSRPNRRAVSIVAPSAKATIGQSSAGAALSGVSAGAIVTNARNNQYASTSPRRPPADASSVLSASRAWRIRPRDAPSAARTASSRRRSAPRASSRLATLAHAIRSTSPTAAARINNAPRNSSSTV